MARNQNTFMSRKSRKSRTSKVGKAQERVSGRTIYFVEYYQSTFFDFHMRLHADIQKILHEICDSNHVAFWKTYDKELPAGGQKAWDLLKKYLEEIDDRIAQIVSTHSIYYWMHAYRRIGVSLSREHRGKIDFMTLALVRTIAETAFKKYGLIDSSNDLVRASKLDSSKVLGGYLVTTWNKWPGSQAMTLDTFLKQLATTNQYVISGFSEKDFLDLYRIEFLSYEYWHTTAKLRAVGKGAKIYLENDGLIQEDRTNELSTLLESYDARIDNAEFESANVGVGFYDIDDDRIPIVLVQHNAMQLTFPELVPPKLKGLLPKDATPNFQVGVINLLPYIRTHEFLSKAFSKKYHISLNSVYFYIAALTWIYLGNALNGTDNYLWFMNLYQRAYSVIPHEGMGMAKKLYDIYNNDVKLKSIFAGITEESLVSVHEFLILRKAKQSSVCLWTYGPRFPFLELEDGILVDWNSTIHILQNLFYGLHASDSEKGTIFEDNFRSFLLKSGLDLLPDRKLIGHNGESREVDAAVRRGSTLFICECRAMERPLDYEIGKIKTLEYRQQELTEKIDQVTSVSEYVRNDPVGRNYDFAWAKKIVPIVVSPYVEWMWSKDKKYWLDKRYPIILSGQEVEKFISGFNDEK